MDGKRLFLAIDISDAARAVCSSHVQSLRAEFPQARVGWERPEKLHITLKFLGSTSTESLARLEGGLTSIAAGHRPFHLKLSGAGSFPERGNPRVLWIGVDGSTDDLFRLQEDLEQVCVALGYVHEQRSFHPHVTLGRLRDRSDAIALAEFHRAARIEPVEFEVRRVVIYESKLLPTGSVYSKLSTLPLVKGVSPNGQK